MILLRGYSVLNTKYIPLVDPTKIYLPPFHFKRGLFKNHFKARNENGEEYH